MNRYDEDRWLDEEFFSDEETDDERGCGSRVEGGLYAVVDLTDEGGLPLECFLMDPPIAVERLGIDLPARGTAWLFQPTGPEEGQGVWHLVDRIGMGKKGAAGGYWDVTRFVEEARRLGISRRLSSALPLDRITKESRLLLAHDRGLVKDPLPYRDHGCPLSKDPRREEVAAEHLNENYTGPCAGFWWRDLDPEHLVGTEVLPGKDSAVVKMPCGGHYTARLRPEGVTPEYIPAVIASFPLDTFVMVEARDGSHEETYSKIQDTLPAHAELRLEAK